MTLALVEQWRQELGGADAGEILRSAATRLGDGLVMATALGAEDQVLTDLAVRLGLRLRIFTLDTGRLFPETYDLLAATEARYGLRIQVYTPDTRDAEELVNRHGINLFRTSPELRRQCCEVRKVRPLRRALAGATGWVCGLRRGQGTTRHEIQPIEWDAGNGLVRICPLANWSEAQVWEYLRANRVPYSPLHDQGMPSVGCACCTRAVPPGEDPRSGRWWWERGEHKECGLHRHPVCHSAQAQGVTA